MNVTVKYRLSADGQRAALIAGRPASREVAEVMELTDTSLLPHVKVEHDGSLTLDTTGYHRGAAGALTFDAPPADISEVIRLHEAYRAAIDNKLIADEAERQRKYDEAVLEKQRAIERDAPAVASILAELEALDPAAPLPPGLLCQKYQSWIYPRDGAADALAATPDDLKRLTAVADRREKATLAAANAAKAAEAAQRDAIIAQHGGMWWEAGMCSFLGYGLWGSGQTKRWVGVFTAPKGIARFCDSPRGEHVFDVRDLEPGECIQGGGYDTNSRGKRRNETEWFGVVIKNDDTGLVIRKCASRSDAMAQAKKL
jgi:hypothetical protein